MRRRGFLCLLAVVLGWIAPAQITPSTSGPDRWVFGVYAGWSRGLGWEFDWHYRSSISDRTSLQLHFGAYAKYEISRLLGVQLDLNYQSGLNEWTFRRRCFKDLLRSNRAMDKVTSPSSHLIYHCQKKLSRLGGQENESLY